MRAIVLGAGGFIGTHLVRRLKAEGYWVRGVDVKPPQFAPSEADEFLLLDLRDRLACAQAIGDGSDELFQLAADMGVPATSLPVITMPTSCATQR